MAEQQSRRPPATRGRRLRFTVLEALLSVALWLWWLLAGWWTAARRARAVTQRCALAGVGLLGVVGVLALVETRPTERTPAPADAPLPAAAPQVASPPASDGARDPARTSAVSGRRICLDPGHGGADPGTFFVFADGGVLREAEVALDIALALTQRLKAQGAHVTLTRQTDQALTLDERAERCNTARAEVTLSVHFNGVMDPTINGALALHGKASDEPLAKAMAVVLQRELFDNQQPEAIAFGARHFGARVLLSTTMPAVLVEPTFLTHPAEAEALLAPTADPTSRRAQIVRALERGIQAYLAAVGRRQP